jgi:hypothetical protein
MDVPPSSLGVTDPRHAKYSVSAQGLASDPAADAVVKLLLGGADIPAVSDLNWKIVGTGHIDQTGLINILWRYNGPGGSNVLWTLDGTGQILYGTELMPVSDLNWEIVGTGDFNNDRNDDILWRYNGPGGYNVVWFMNDGNWIGSAELLPVADLNWQIVGTGDFNGDGKVDILWRYNGSGGYVYVWYMNGTNWIGGGNLISVTDLNWQIVGTGDYNNDAKVDILWRYNASPGYVYIWYLNGVNWIGGADLLPVQDLTWKIVSR